MIDEKNQSNETKKICFYTAALNEDINKIIESTNSGLELTPYIKIKLNNAIPLGIKILEALYSNLVDFDL